MFFIDLIMERFLQTRNDDFFDENTIEKADNDDIEQQREQQFKSPMRWA